MQTLHAMPHPLLLTAQQRCEQLQHISLIANATPQA